MPWSGFLQTDVAIQKRRGKTRETTGETRRRTGLIRAGRIAFQQNARLGAAGVGHGGQQGLGVGMQRALVQHVNRRQFDDLAEVHHGHPLTEMRHDGEVVRDEQVGHALFALQVLQQV